MTTPEVIPIDVRIQSIIKPLKDPDWYTEMLRVTHEALDGLIDASVRPQSAIDMVTTTELTKLRTLPTPKAREVARELEKLIGKNEISLDLPVKTGNIVIRAADPIDTVSMQLAESDALHDERQRVLRRINSLTGLQFNYHPIPFYLRLGQFIGSPTPSVEELVMFTLARAKPKRVSLSGLVISLGGTARYMHTQAET